MIIMIVIILIIFYDMTKIHTKTRQGQFLDKNQMSGNDHVLEQFLDNSNVQNLYDYFLEHILDIFWTFFFYRDTKKLFKEKVEYK